MEETDAIKKFGAIAHQGRLGLLRQLIQAGPDGLSAGELASNAGVGATTASAQLLVLSNAGLVESEREGRSIRYRSSYPALQGLMRFLFQDCCANNPDICRAVVEELSA